MASPQRSDYQGEPGRDDSETKGLRPGRPRGRGTFLFGWLVGVVLLGAFFYWIAWGWEGTGGYWWHNQSAPVHGAYGHSIKGSGLNALNATDKQPFLDKNFQVSNVPIQKKVSNRIYWVGPQGRPPMLVVVTGNASSADLKQLTAGTLADVAGTIDKAPTAAEAESEWALSNPGIARLEKEGAYVRASEMIWASNQGPGGR